MLRTLSLLPYLYSIIINFIFLNQRINYLLYKLNYPIQSIYENLYFYVNLEFYHYVYQYFINKFNYTIIL